MVKLISLSEEAYKVLKQLKKDSMSFSDTILKHLNHERKNKTEDLEGLIKWIKSIKSVSKKEKISKNVDEIVYGIKR
ncbi:MAG TPA: antitoxin VapB family protein [Candidatus Nanoarchaeia archaeon]|nr:antitoxin VapB family protein [Candidatus Nanoarchaeia archaeon]